MNTLLNSDVDDDCVDRMSQKYILNLKQILNSIESDKNTKSIEIYSLIEEARKNLIFQFDYCYNKNLKFFILDTICHLIEDSNEKLKIKTFDLMIHLLELDEIEFGNTFLGFKLYNKEILRLISNIYDFFLITRTSNQSYYDEKNKIFIEKLVNVVDINELINNSLFFTFIDYSAALDLDLKQNFQIFKVILANALNVVDTQNDVFRSNFLRIIGDFIEKFKSQIEYNFYSLSLKHEWIELIKLIISVLNRNSQIDILRLFLDKINSSMFNTLLIISRSLERELVQDIESINGYLWINSLMFIEVFIDQIEVELGCLIANYIKAITAKLIKNCLANTENRSEIYDKIKERILSLAIKQIKILKIEFCDEIFSSIEIILLEGIQNLDLLVLETILVLYQVNKTCSEVYYFSLSIANSINNVIKANLNKKSIPIELVKIVSELVEYFSIFCYNGEVTRIAKPLIDNLNLYFDKNTNKTKLGHFIYFYGNICSFITGEMWIEHASNIFMKINTIMNNNYEFDIDDEILLSCLNLFKNLIYNYDGTYEISIYLYDMSKYVEYIEYQLSTKAREQEYAILNLFTVIETLKSLKNELPKNNFF